MITITIEWGVSHHPGDGVRLIEDHLAAGLDEGPLLVVSARRRPGPGRKSEALILADVASYLAHLVEHGGDLDDERWVGLVRDVGSGEQAHALAALQHLKDMVGPSGTSRARSSRKGSSPPPSYLVLQGPFTTEAVLSIVNIGEGFSEIAHAVPGLEEEMRFPSEDEW
jgi:hypothetical protein